MLYTNFNQKKCITYLDQKKEDRFLGARSAPTTIGGNSIIVTQYQTNIANRILSNEKSLT